MPDGPVRDQVNATPRKDLHPDRFDSYLLEWDDVERGLYVTATRGSAAGRQALILGVHSIVFEPEEELQVGKGKAGPGRGNRGPLQPEVA